MKDEDEVPDIDWTDVDLGMAQQILAQGELHLQSQVSLAIAADQRATTAASIFASTAAAVAAAFIAFWDKSQNQAALIGGLVAAGLLLIAASFAAWAARPTDFHIPGNHPSQWFSGIRHPLVGMIGGEAESVQRRIEANDRIMAGNQAALRHSFWIALLGPFVALGAWLYSG
jgi:hypothetical protein